MTENLLSTRILVVQFVPPQIAGENKTKCTSIISTVALSLLFEIRNVLFFYFWAKTPPHKNFHQKKTSVTYATTFWVNYFLKTAAKVCGWIAKGGGEIKWANPNLF